MGKLSSLRYNLRQGFGCQRRLRLAQLSRLPACLADVSRTGFLLFLAKVPGLCPDA